ncbi:hypothetical protein [Streptomyces sp. NPDC060031]
MPTQRQLIADRRDVTSARCGLDRAEASGGAASSLDHERSGLGT